MSPVCGIFYFLNSKSLYADVLSDFHLLCDIPGPNGLMISSKATRVQRYRLQEIGFGQVVELAQSKYVNKLDGVGPIDNRPSTD